MLRQGKERLGAPKVGLVTIGQSPRVDIVPELKQVLRAELGIVEEGALDGLSLSEIESLAPGKNDYVLVTRLTGGGSVSVSRRRIIPLIQERVNHLSKTDVVAIVLLCTSEFATLKSNKPLIEPARLLNGVVRGVTRQDKIGVMVPSQDQVTETSQRWLRIGFHPHVEVANPYRGVGEIEEAARAMARSKPNLIVMDCMGYSNEMKDTVKEIANVPVILPRSVLAKVISELV